MTIEWQLESFWQSNLQLVTYSFYLKRRFKMLGIFFMCLFNIYPDFLIRWQSTLHLRTSTTIWFTCWSRRTWRAWPPTKRCPANAASWPPTSTLNRSSAKTRWPMSASRRTCWSRTRPSQVCSSFCFDRISFKLLNL